MGANIPLPALNIHAPEQGPGLLQQYAQMMGIQNAQQERQLRAQQIQGEQLQNQQRQINVADQTKLRDLYVKHGGDLDKVIKDAPGAGVSPQSVNALQLHNTDVKSKLADVDAKTLANEQAKADLYQGAYDAIQQSPVEKKPQVYQQQLAALSQRGLDVSKMPAQYPGDDQFEVIGAGVKGHKQMVEDALKAAQLPGIAADSAKKVKENVGTNAVGMTAAQQSEAAARKRTGDIEAGRLAEEKRYHDLQAGIGGPTAGGVAGPAQMSQVPEALRGTVQGILDYRQNMPPMSRSNPRNSMIQYWVNKLDPQYDASQFPARNKLIQNYTSGPQSKEINAINTAMGHVGVLGDALKALDNGDVKVINSIANKLGVQVGQTPAATVNLIVHRVGPELTSAYVQGGGGEADRGTTASDFDTSLGKDILKTNVGTTAKLLRSKIGSLENQYKQTVKRDDFQQRFITPEAQEALDKYSPKSAASSTVSTFAVKAPNGKTYSFPDQASADAFKAKLPK
jgi:hypothetical protein